MAEVFSKHEIEVLKSVIKKIEETQSNQKVRIKARRKSQLKGKTINKRIQKKKKPVRKSRVAKKRASIR